MHFWGIVGCCHTECCADGRKQINTFVMNSACRSSKKTPNCSRSLLYRANSYFFYCFKFEHGEESRQESSRLCDKKRETTSSCPNAGVQILKKKKRQKEKSASRIFFKFPVLLLVPYVEFQVLKEFTVKTAGCVQIPLKMRPNFLTSLVGDYFCVFTTVECINKYSEFLRFILIFSCL